MKKIKSPHNYKNTPIDTFCEILLFSLLPFIVLICVIILYTTKSHCASVSNTEIPYIVPNWVNANNFLPTQALENAQTRYINDVRNYFHYQGELSYLVFVTDGIINGSTYQIFFITNPTIIENYPDNYDFHSGNIKVKSNNVQLLAVNVRVSDNYVTGDAINLGTEATLCGSSATVTIGNGNMTSRYPFLMVGTDEIKSANDKVIFTNIAPVVIPTGHATPPDEFEEPIYPTGSQIPAHVPHLTINNYTWTTTPTPDFSTLETIGESIYHFLQWLGTNLMGSLTNIVNNLTNVGDFIGQTIQYFGALIIKTIQNGITTFYNNMVSLFEPIANAIDYISQPLDMDSLTDTVNSTQIFDDVDTCTTFANDAFGIYGTVAEPNSFKIPLDLRSISLLNITQVYYIDLSWLDGAKTAIRAFMWCVVTFGLLYSVIVDIPNMIRSSK